LKVGLWKKTGKANNESFRSTHPNGHSTKLFMAVFKANYVKRGKTERQRIKATVRYIQHRPGHDQEKITRKLFGLDGVLTRHQAYRLIDEAKKGSLFYRFVISPDPRIEDSGRDLNLREITEKTMRRLSTLLKQQITWVAAEHNDHAPHRHAHLVAIVRQKLNSLDFKYLRLAATEASLFQRQQLDLARGIRRDRFVHHPRYKGHHYSQNLSGRKFSQGNLFTRQLTSTNKASRGVAAPRIKTCFCYHCGLRQAKSYFGGQQNCLRCGSEIKQGRTITLVKEAKWER
jgi:hypothetical protein